jgi:predicted transcriptional regulator
VNTAHFDGPAYVPALDQARLTGQLQTIFTLMRDGQWRTLREVETATGFPQASISAQLRHLRKQRFGSYQLEKRRRGIETRGLYEYRLLPPVSDDTQPRLW